LRLPRPAVREERHGLRFLQDGAPIEAPFDHEHVATGETLCARDRPDGIRGFFHQQGFASRHQIGVAEGTLQVAAKGFRRQTHSDSLPSPGRFVP
jgi:hypothetical protein